MKSRSYYIINSITIYRIVACPVLIVMAFMGYFEIYKWLLPISFFTDLIDGFLARRFKVASILGSQLDSIGDDLTVLAAVIGLFIFKLDFILNNLFLSTLLLGLYLLQLLFAFIRYGRLTSFHTYMAKFAFLFQGFFLILIFLLPDPIYWLFYLAAFVSIIDLIEEIIITMYLKKWEANVKGLYWVLRRKKLEKIRT